MNPIIHQHKLRQALAICNRLAPSATKGRHASRLITALNRVRPVAKRASVQERISWIVWMHKELTPTAAQAAENLRKAMETLNAN